MKLHVTANTLASFITAKTPERKQSIVRTARRAQQNDKGYAPYYQSLRGPARRFLTDGARDASELRKLIEEMSARTGNKWHKTDARITSEAAKALIKLAPKLRELEVTYVLPKAGTKSKLEFPEIDVLVTPDMLVEKQKNNVTRAGAMRFYTAKESTYELGQKGAELVAVMQHQWLLTVASGRVMPDSSLCMVIECFQQRITTAPANTDQLLKIIEQGCHDFVRLWHGLDSKDAA